jgi:hypothetical protein
MVDFTDRLRTSNISGRANAFENDKKRDDFSVATPKSTKILELISLKYSNWYTVFLVELHDL